MSKLDHYLNDQVASEAVDLLIPVHTDTLVVGVGVRADHLIKLIQTDGNGEGGDATNPIGYIVGLPQGCVASLNNKVDPNLPNPFKPDKNLYVTPEWIDQIFFVAAGPDPQDENTALAAVNDARSYYSSLNPSPIDNIRPAKGCGFVSAKVGLQQVRRTGTKWATSSYFLDGYKYVFSIAPSGRMVSQCFVPDNMWISTTQWAPGAEKIKAAVDVANTYKPASSPCSYE